ncbi:MAG TPA: hypothetical protein VHV30_17600 [Polyangiaceae bacterium]|nr:hypothetical protein [Polyangiaceae bacterium]
MNRASGAKGGASALPAADPGAPPTLTDAAKTLAWGLVFWGGEQLASAVFERSATAMAAAQAAVAEWGAGRLGIAWTDARSGAPPSPPPAQRAAVGAALGLGAAAAVVALAVALGGARVVPGAPSLGVLVVGLFVAACAAVRDELLLRGVVVRSTRILPLGATLLACGLAAAAARFGTELAAGGRPGGAVLVEGLRGAAFGGLWIRDRGAWMACAANAAWTWSLGPAASGGLLDVRFAGSPGASPAAFVVCALAAAGACAWALRAAASARVAP